MVTDKSDISVIPESGDEGTPARVASTTIDTVPESEDDASPVRDASTTQTLLYADDDTDDEDSREDEVMKKMVAGAAATQLFTDASDGISLHIIIMYSFWTTKNCCSASLLVIILSPDSLQVNLTLHLWITSFNKSVILGPNVSFSKYRADDLTVNF